MENNDIYKLCEEFGVTGEIVGVSIMTSGHINSTFKVDVDDNGKMKSYIIQKVNDYVFKKPEELMENIEENSTNFQNSIDILPIIWENILMEIPMRVISDEADISNIKVEGEGWKFVTEEEEKTSPLSELLEYLDE